MDIIAQQGYNAADLIVIVTLLVGLLLGSRAGIVGMALKVVYGVASFGASLIFYPLVSGFIRKTPLFDTMKNSILNGLGLENAVQTYTKQQEVNLIGSLRLPEPVKDKLLENNNSVIYELVGADGFVDYIAGFVANLVINVVMVWLLFVLFLFLLRIFFKGIELLSKLPVISRLNHLGGAAMGVLFAVILIWIVYTAVYAFIAQPKVYGFYEYIAASKVAVWFYDHNLLLDLILKRLF